MKICNGEEGKLQQVSRTSLRSLVAISFLLCRRSRPCVGVWHRVGISIRGQGQAAAPTCMLLESRDKPRLYAYVAREQGQATASTFIYITLPALPLAHSSEHFRIERERDQENNDHAHRQRIAYPIIHLHIAIDHKAY